MTYVNPFRSQRPKDETGDIEKDTLIFLRLVLLGCCFLFVAIGIVLPLVIQWLT